MFFTSFSSISGYFQHLILGWPTMLLSPSWSFLLLQVRSYNSSTQLQGNTYPLVGCAAITDTGSGDSFTVSTQRPMGMSSVDNSLEFSLHRSHILHYTHRVLVTTHTYSTET